MFLVECSYDYTQRINPWKVTLTEPYKNSTVKTERLKTDADVVARIKEYKSTYGDKLLVSEKVYMQGPRLDFVHLYD